MKKKKNKKSLPGKKARTGESAHLERVINGLRKNRNGLKDKIKQQSNQLKAKNGQLRNGAEKQKRSETQIEIDKKEIAKQREELLHVTRVGKLAEFVSSLAHEISQPLTAILSYAQAAQRKLAGREPEIEKILSYIISDDQRAIEVIQRLRALLKKSAPEMNSLDINTVVDETILLMATDANVRNITLKNELENDLLPVRADRVQLQQVLLNLISNGFDALEGSKGKREIVIRTKSLDANTIGVEVKDFGRGVPAGDISKLFTHFFTSKLDGLGMGLSISRSIVEAHGGKLSVKNNSNRGVTFYFTLPVNKKDSSEP